MHVAVRGRSKRVTEYLLRNPKNARLLYVKNKSGETPYQLDAGFDRSVLSQVFAAREFKSLPSYWVVLDSGKTKLEISINLGLFVITILSFKPVDPY